MWSFVDHLKVRALGTGRLAKHVFKLRIMLEILGVDVDKARRKDVERLVLRLEEKHFRPVTLIDYLFIIKRFFKFVKYGRAEFLTPSEVKSMIVAASER